MFPVPGDALEGIYYAHDRWYVADTGLWFSPDEKGEFLYGSGQDTVNDAWIVDTLVAFGSQGNFQRSLVLNGGQFVTDTALAGNQAFYPPADWTLADRFGNAARATLPVVAVEGLVIAPAYFGAAGVVEGITSVGTVICSDSDCTNEVGTVIGTGRAFIQAGILPRHVAALSKYANETGYTIVFRTTKVGTNFWRILQVGAKPEGYYPKTNALGIVRAPQGPWLSPRGWYRSDLDLAVVLDRADKYLTNKIVEDEIVPELNKILTGSPLKTEIMHGAHFTWEQAATKLGPPGNMIGVAPNGIIRWISAEEAFAFATRFHLPWPW